MPKKTTQVILSSVLIKQVLARAASGGTDKELADLCDYSLQIWDKEVEWSVSIPQGGVRTTEGNPEKTVQELVSFSRNEVDDLLYIEAANGLQVGCANEQESLDMEDFPSVTGLERYRGGTKQIIYSYDKNEDLISVQIQFSSKSNIR